MFWIDRILSFKLTLFHKTNFILSYILLYVVFNVLSFPLIRGLTTVFIFINYVDTKFYYIIYKTLASFAGVTGLEPATYGFGDRCSTN